MFELQIVNALKQGQSVALVSDAGMPTINDPGAQLIAAVAAEGIKVVPISGPSAFLLALVASGMMDKMFTFCGFMDAKRSQRMKHFSDLKGTTNIDIF